MQFVIVSLLFFLSPRNLFKCLFFAFAQTVPVGGTSEDLNNVSSRFASSARPDEMVLPELPDDVLECELCGRKGRRKNFMRSGRFCGKYCTRSFSSAFRVADQSAGKYWVLEFFIYLYLFIIYLFFSTVQH